MVMSDPRDSVSGDSSLMQAIRQGNQTRLQQLLKEGQFDLTYKNSLRQDALMVYKACYPDFFSNEPMIAIKNISEKELTVMDRTNPGASQMYEILKSMLEKIRSKVVSGVTEDARSTVEAALRTSAYLKKKNKKPKNPESGSSPSSSSSKGNKL